MADPHPSTRDRSHGGAPGEHPGASVRAFWIGVLMILVLLVAVIVAVG
ncbi:hypothetical protein [Streptacidiphilus neutrinimicus]|nr:hypothetical protein [Streptacidiphilus neutrinimicus]